MTDRANVVEIFPVHRKPVSVALLLFLGGGEGLTNTVQAYVVADDRQEVSTSVQ